MKRCSKVTDRARRRQGRGAVGLAARRVVKPTLLLTFALASACQAQSARPHTDLSGSDAMAQERVVLITGSTSGLGRELALELAATGAHVIVHGRDPERGREVVEQIGRAGGAASFHAADLASLREVREMGEAILRDYPRLDLLINNAGIWQRDARTRELSADGHELSFAVNYLSHFLLTRMLLPRLQESAPSRIINVSSGAQTPIDFDDVMLERGFTGSRAYAQSKLAQILFTADLVEELEGTGVTVTSLHPATLMDTPMVEGAGVRPRSSVREGVEAVLSLVNAADLGGQIFFDGSRPARAHEQAYDPEARRRLRLLSERLTARP
jgi:NAD(P)-dependent dehydrogenase (short-subunit alcohol dehydrogenase family)